MADSLSRITEEVVRHRLSEGVDLVRAAERVLREIPAVAGSVNGITAAAEARASELNALATKIDEHAKSLRTGTTEPIAERVDDGHTEAVRVAKKAEQQKTSMEMAT